MKRLLVAFTLLVIFTSAGIAPDQNRGAELTVWTSCSNQGALDIWIDDRFQGTLDKFYTGTPRAGSPGTISVVVKPGQHKIYAQNKNRSKKWGPRTINVPANGLIYNFRCN